jgi:hypothetical protein
LRSRVGGTVRVRPAATTVFGVRREGQRHAAFGSQSPQKKRCRRCALPPQSKSLSSVREALLGKLVLVLSRATPEELAALYHFATGQTLESAECGVRS